MKKDVIFINSHPIQYFTPLYKYMNERGVSTACWYCSDEALQGRKDPEFGLQIKWDIPLLEGYKFRFFKNFSWRPSHSNGFFGLINLGMLRALARSPKSVIVVHGYHYFTHTCLLLMGRFLGHTMCLRCELPYSQEVLKTGWLQTIKKLYLKIVLFPRVDTFLYIGEQNRLFYKSHGIQDKRLILCPYAVDNERFQLESASLSSQRFSLRARLGISESDKVILFVAKYIEKKRPLDILHAFARLDRPDIWLIMVGEGELRPEMEQYITLNKLKNVILTGFVNQSSISEYYSISDLFVMCSGIWETWGLSTNEAMNFNLPVILSNLSGSSTDLVKEGVNGYTFKTGDIEDLEIKIRKVLIDNSLTGTVSSVNIIDKFSYDTIIKNITVLTD